MSDIDGVVDVDRKDSRVEGVLHVDGVEGETPMSGDKDIGRR